MCILYISKTSNEKNAFMLPSKRAACNGKKRFQANGLLNKLGIKISVSKIPLLGDTLF